MYIEDIVSNLTFQPHIFQNHLNFLSSYHQDFILNISDQIDRGMGLTRKQADLIVKILHRYSQEISALLHVDITNHLGNPQFRMQERIVSQDKYVKIETIDNVKVIAVYFPYNEDLIQKIKEYQKEIIKHKKFNTFFSLSEIKWNRQNRFWEFTLKEEHIVWINLNFSEFLYDEEFSNYVSQILEIQKNIDCYVPMITYDGEFHFINVHPNVGQPTSDNLIEVLLQAKKYGINTWDDSINCALNSPLFNPVLKSFFNHSHDEPFYLNERNSSLENIEDIIDFSKNILFVIPGGNELIHLEKIYKFLKEKNVDEKDISVMFRLDNNQGKEFNEFVKEKKLNSPLTNNTKYVFVSGKMPKPVLSVQNNFDLVIHFGTNSAHYTLKNYIRNHYNVITMNLINDNKEFDFGNM